MLKSTFTPIFSTILVVPLPKRLRRLPTRTIIASASPTTTPAIRQNASLATPATVHLCPPTSAYVHLPFCRKRCHYCDFPVVALGSSSPTDNDPRISNYIELLQREIVSSKPEFDIHHPPLETVFFGGGTPSLVAPQLVSSILDTLRVNFGLSTDAEISMEMDPGTFDAKKMEELTGFGVNRVSLGVQAFQEELLRSCGRAHGVKEIYEAIEIVGTCEVENWSMDLISSLPHQTPQMWEESLRLTIEAQPKHVSVYDLQVEQGTKFGTLYTPGEFPLPSETQSADLYIMASRMLSDAGYSHYEISSYCKDGFECKHNFTYWKNQPFYGFGLGSASCVKGIRFSRPRKMKEYVTYVQDLEGGLVNHCGNDLVDARDWAMDVLMLSLRTARGLDLRFFKEACGSSLVCSLCKVYKPYIESGHVVGLDAKRRVMTADEFNNLCMNEDDIAEVLAYIRLSDPDGFLLSNELISLAFGVIGP